MADMAITATYGFFLKNEDIIKSIAMRTALKTLGLKTLMNKNNIREIIVITLMISIGILNSFKTTNITTDK